MTLITDDYRALNARAHEEGTGYGIRGYKHLQPALALAELYGGKSVLDYGCGQGTLAAHARRVSDLPFFNYDPAVPQWAAMPTPADIVVCTDVLEHVEPLCITNVVKHIAELTQKAAYLQIACREAGRVLADGRNAHLLVRDGMFWFDLIREYMDIVKFTAKPGHDVVIVAVPGGTAWK